MKMRDLITESSKKLVLEPLGYSRAALDPTMSKELVDFHYGKLAKGYVERFNNHEGDPDFNEAGAFLHNLFFAQFLEAGNTTTPSGAIEKLIVEKYGDFPKFKEEFKAAALAIQGSGWVYLSRAGVIKTIKNHKIVTDVVFLIDMWEHAFQMDYMSNKAKYVDNIWKIIDWGKIEARLI